MKLRTKNRNPRHLSNDWIIILILLYLSELFMLNFVLFFLPTVLISILMYRTAMYKHFLSAEFTQTIKF